MEPLLQVHDLTVCYGSQARHPLVALRNLNFELAAGEAVGLLGESGCGKTTLALSILRLLPNTARVLSGSIVFRGTDLLAVREHELQKIRGAEISMVYQEPAMALNPVLRVGDQVAEVLRAHKSISRAQARKEANALLGQVGLPPDQHLNDAYPHQLSGGQRQRVVIAQAIACRPALLIADEPTTALDAVVQAEILALLKTLKENLKSALVLISHNPAVLAQIVDRVIVMYAGRLIEEGPAAQVFRKPLHPYTRGLLQAGVMGAKQKPKQPLEAVPGEAPDSSSLPAGCLFEPRCADRMEICRSRDPEDFRPEALRRVACLKYEH